MILLLVLVLVGHIMNARESTWHGYITEIILLHSQHGISVFDKEIR